MKPRPAPAADESATRGVSPPAPGGGPPTSPSTVTEKNEGALARRRSIGHKTDGENKKLDFTA